MEQSVPLNIASPTKRDSHVVAPELSGEYYASILKRLHNVLQPKRYLEIGTNSGQSLALAKCATVAIDPNFQISSNVWQGKPSCHLFQCTSDVFFRERDPAEILGGPIDFAFLDGMHWCEMLLRDFINTEGHCNRNSIIAIHDCLPVDIHVARRDTQDRSSANISEHPEWWTGDVWKTALLLKRHRQDLKIYAFDSQPTGLILITNLDPKNNTLESRYFDILEELRTMSLEEIGLDQYMQELGILSTSAISTSSQISEFFWL